MGSAVPNMLMEACLHLFKRLINGTIIGQIYEYVHEGKIWHDPQTKAQLIHCPWLTKQANNIYTCAIYFDRPEDCRYYPSTIQEMIQDQCEMLEANDLRDVRNAQKRLNNIMADSHK